MLVRILLFYISTVFIKISIRRSAYSPTATNIISDFIFYEKNLALLRRIGTGLRAKFKGTEVPRILVLRTDLRHGKREPAVTIPPVVRPDAVREEPATIAATVSAQQERIAVGVVDGFVHGNDVP